MVIVEASPADDMLWRDGEGIVKTTHPRRLYRFPLIFGAICLTTLLLAYLAAHLVSA